MPASSSFVSLFISVNGDARKRLNLGSGGCLVFRINLGTDLGILGRLLGFELVVLLHQFSDNRFALLKLLLHLLQLCLDLRRDSLAFVVVTIGLRGLGRQHRFQALGHAISAWAVLVLHEDVAEHLECRRKLWKSWFIISACSTRLVV